MYSKLQKNWDGRLMHTMSCLDIEYMVCETIPKNKSEKPKNFKLVTQRNHVFIRMKVVNMKHSINAQILYFGVNSNKATAGHKLQGVSLNSEYLLVLSCSRALACSSCIVKLALSSPAVVRTSEIL